MKVKPKDILKLYTDYTRETVKSEYGRSFDDYKNEYFSEEKTRALKRTSKEYKLSEEVDVVQDAKGSSNN